MKLDINIRVLFSGLFLIFFMSVFYAPNANAKPDGTSTKAEQNACGGNGTGTITQPGTISCELESDIFKITFTRLDLCRTDPTPPTISTPIDRSTCATFFRKDSGAETTVIKGVAGSIGESADYSAVPHGTYDFGVVTMLSTFKYTSSVLFNGEMGDTDGGGNTTTCVTKAPAGGASTVIYGFHNGLDADNSNVDCSANAVAEEIIIGINTMTMDGDNHCNHLLNFTGTSGTVNGYAVQADGTLVDAVGVAPNDKDQIRNGVAGCASGTDNGIKAVIGVMPFAESIVIGPSTSGLQMEYNTSQSMRLDMTNTNDDIYKFDVAFFDFTLKAKKARSPRGTFN